MRVDSVELRLVPLKLRERFEISSGGRQDRLILLVTLHGDGLVGWGECVVGEDPGYSYETTETAWHVLTDFLIPAVIGKDFARAEDVMDAMRWVRGHRMAKASIEMAAWDLQARLDHVPLAVAIGGSVRPIPVGVSVGLQPTDDALLERVAGYVAEGYRRIKIKIKPGRDVEMLTRVRERFPDVPLVADANAAYTLVDADHLAKLDPLKLLMIEQPLAFDDLREHARLQRRIETSVCLDESIESEEDASFALELGACRVINIKPGRVGGFASAKAIHDLCADAGVPVWCGGMLESGIGRAHNLSLASLPNFSLPGDISESRRYWSRDIVRPEFVLKDGTLTLPAGDGIAVEPDIEMIESLVVRRAIFPRA